MKMMALSVRQPWASLIIEGLKVVENRTWATRYRGPLLIHASKSYNKSTRPPIHDTIKEHPPIFPLGAIIGIVNLVGCVTEHKSYWFEGPYGFVLENAHKFKDPIPYKGRPGMFMVDLSSDPFLLVKYT